MKLLIISALTSLFFNINAWANIDREVVISFEDLPKTAQNFINKHFPQQEILSIVCEKEIGSKEYSIYYDNGTEVKFDRKGNWESVECEYSSVPDSIIPRDILALVRSKHPEKKITSITRDLTGRDKGYEVDLDDIVEMRFDLEGRFIRYDD